MQRSAPITRRSTPVQQPLAFLSNSFPNLIGVSKRKYNVCIRQLLLWTPASCALCRWTHCCVGPPWASALASFMATPPLPFHTSTLHARSRPSSSGVQMVKALHHAGAAMFMKSTPGCGTLAGHSLGLGDFLSQKRRRFAKSPTSRRAWQVMGRGP